MPRFETFTKRMSPRSTEPYITIQKRGTMSINRASYELLGEPEAVELLFDRSDEVMGLRKVDRSSAHAYPLRGSGSRQSSFMLSGMAFTKYYGIDTSVARRYVAVLEAGVLQANLKGEFTEVVSNRSKKRLTQSSPSEPTPHHRDS